MKADLLQYLSKYFSTDQISKIQISPVPRGQTGDLAVAFFQLAKELKQSPVQIAQSVSEKLTEIEFIERTKIAGPYLNVFFTLDYLAAQCLETPLETNTLQGKHITIEYSGPNTNKPLHLGHMRNHALGISMCNVFEACGATVHRVNIINDRGIAICKSMLAYKLYGEGKTPESENMKGDAFVGQYYVLFDQKVKEQPELLEQAQAMLVDWEASEPETRALWKLMTDWTLEGHNSTYKRQGVWFEKVYQESDHYEDGVAFAKQGLSDGAFQARADGTIYLDMEEENMGEKVVLRADGTAIYLTQDISLWPKRKNDFPKTNLMMHVVADEQTYYFKTVFACLDKLGLSGESRFHHLAYGLVNLPDGRMKSREGTVVDADPLMDELQKISAEKIRENKDFSEEKTMTIADQVQNAAWKFFLLKTSPNKSIVFEAEKSLDFQGATGPYLQYAGVRIRSILQKAQKQNINFSPLDKGEVPEAEGIVETKGTFSEAERGLLVKITEWPDTLKKAQANYNPTYIVTYLLELAQDWSSFYAANSVLNAETEDLKNARLELANKIFEILQKGLEILGIEIPEEM